MFFAKPLQRSNLCASHRQRRWLTHGELGEATVPPRGVMWPGERERLLRHEIDRPAALTVVGLHIGGYRE